MPQSLKCGALEIEVLGAQSLCVFWIDEQVSPVGGFRRQCSRV